MPLAQHQGYCGTFTDSLAFRQPKCRDLASRIERKKTFCSMLTRRHVDRMSFVVDAELVKQDLHYHRTGHRLPIQSVGIRVAFGH